LESLDLLGAEDKRELDPRLERLNPVFHLDKPCDPPFDNDEAGVVLATSKSKRSKIFS